MSRRRTTRLVHAGEQHTEGAVVDPIFQSATFLEEPGLPYDEIRYARLNNTPNHHGLHEKLASVAEQEAALVTGSGMAAISAALLSVLSAGDEVLVQRGLYGGTHALFTSLLPRLGIRVHFVDGDDEHSWEDARTLHTRAVYCEALTNPLLHVTDLPGIADFARRHGLISFVDNTFAGPMMFRSSEFGFDVELHSATKSLNGHSDLCAGVVLGSAHRVAEARRTLNLLGGTLDPHAAWLLQRGMKTLGIRMQAMCRGATHLARVLDEHPDVCKVLHPSLPQHPSYERASEWFDQPGFMLAFEVDGGAPAAQAVLEALELPLVAPSLGGVETLVTRPAVSSHASMSPAERASLGISDGLIRVSVGIEDPDDLAADFVQALGLCHDSR